MTDNNEKTRRKFIRNTAVAVSSATILSSGSVIAEEKDYTDIYNEYQPEYVSISFDERKELIKEYEPYLNTFNLDIEPESCQTAYYESNEYDTDVIAYIYYYPTQIGNYGGLDSHYRDREPVFVFINEDKSINHIVYSGWHYLLAYDFTPSLYENTHPKLNVATEHNHFYTEPEPERGEFYNIFDGRETYNMWFKNNWDADPRIMVEPWLVNERVSMWENDTELLGGMFEFNWSATYAILALRVARLDPRIDSQSDI